MWRADSGRPEVAPAPSQPQGMQPMPPMGMQPPMQGMLPPPGMATPGMVTPGMAPVMPQVGSPVISPVIAPGADEGAPMPGRFSSTVSLARLLQHKGKGSRLRNGIMVVLGIAMVAGAVKLLVSSSSSGPKVATAGPEAATPAPAATLATEPATKPAAKPKTVISANAQGSTAKTSTGAPAPTTIARPKTAAADPKSGKKPIGKTAKSGSSAATSALAADHVDASAGYAVRFPAGWTQRSLAGHGSWLIEASDGKASSIAIGLSSDGGHSTADQQNLDALTKAYKARPETEVQASGFATVAGRKGMFHKLNVPAPAAPGTATPANSARLTTVVYFTPLGDGRALKVRVVSKPETFAEIAPKMRQSMETLRLLSSDSPSKQVAAGE